MARTAVTLGVTVSEVPWACYPYSGRLIYGREFKKIGYQVIQCLDRKLTIETMPLFFKNGATSHATFAFPKIRTGTVNPTK